jgi:very-short-patch-repair endonuclease
VLLSKLEKGFIARLEEADLPLPETNRLTDGHYVDCRWGDKRVTVELDGFRFHNSRHAWEDGLRRQRAARRRGDEFRRYTYTDVFEDPTEMLDELRELLT